MNRMLTNPACSIFQRIANGLTDEQKDIVLRPFPGKESSLVVQAYAGTGKTHTLHAFAAARSEEHIHYLAFNKSMAMEAQAKFKDMKHVKVMTIHSLAYQQIGKKFRHRLGELTPTMLCPLIQRYMTSNVPLYKATAVIKKWYEKFLAGREATPKLFFAKHCLSVHEKALNNDNIDVDSLIAAVDMLWLNVISGSGICGDLPLSHNAYLKLYQLSGNQLSSKYVLIDEAQDVTDCMIDIVLSQHSHKIFIGDSFQQIYAWNGAVDSLRKLEEAGAPSLRLTRSFRCPDTVAEVANKYLRLLGAKETFKGNGPVGKDDRKSCVLARSNTALFRAAWDCVRNRQIPYFLGGFEGYDFEVLLDLQKAMSGRLDKVHNPWLRNEFNSFDEIVEYAEEVDPHLMARCTLVKQYRDKIVDIYLKIKGAQTPQPDHCDVVFSTTHKAKGAEWGAVSLCGDFLDFTKLIENADASEKPVFVRKEELNLLYVGVTRAKFLLQFSFDVSDKTIEVVQEYIRKGKIILTD